MSLGLLIFFLMLAAPLLLFGSMAAYTFYLAYKSEARANASRTWPTTEGKVLASELKRRYVLKTGYVYTPVVRYEYSAGGRRYENDVVAFGITSLKSQKRAEAHVEGRTPGAAVTVHYNPDDPAMAALDTSSYEARSLKRTGWVLVGIIAFVYGLIAYGFMR